MSTRSKLRRDQFLASCARSTRGNVDDRKTNGCKRHCGRISSTDLLGLRTVGKDCHLGGRGISPCCGEVKPMAWGTDAG